MSVVQQNETTYIAQLWTSVTQSVFRVYINHRWCWWQILSQFYVITKYTKLSQSFNANWGQLSPQLCCVCSFFRPLHVWVNLIAANHANMSSKWNIIIKQSPTTGLLASELIHNWTISSSTRLHGLRHTGANTTQCCYKYTIQFTK